MRRGEYRFTDMVSGKPVYYFEDAYGRRWLANNKWAWFRVSLSEEPRP